jgi:hypothetical protein
MFIYLIWWLTVPPLAWIWSIACMYILLYSHVAYWVSFSFWLFWVRGVGIVPNEGKYCFILIPLNPGRRKSIVLVSCEEEKMNITGNLSRIVGSYLPKYWGPLCMFTADSFMFIDDVTAYTIPPEWCANLPFGQDLPYRFRRGKCIIAHRNGQISISAPNSVCKRLIQKHILIDCHSRTVECSVTQILGKTWFSAWKTI